MGATTVNPMLSTNAGGKPMVVCLADEENTQSASMTRWIRLQVAVVILSKKKKHAERMHSIGSHQPDSTGAVSPSMMFNLASANFYETGQVPPGRNFNHSYVPFS